MSDKYIIESNWASIFNQLGLNSLGEVAWEAIPFSFILDWFLKVGDFLQNRDALVGVRVVGHESTRDYRFQTGGAEGTYFTRSYHGRDGLDAHWTDTVLVNPDPFTPENRLRAGNMVTAGLNPRFANAMSLLVVLSDKLHSLKTLDLSKFSSTELGKMFRLMKSFY